MHNQSSKLPDYRVPCKSGSCCLSAHAGARRLGAAWSGNRGGIGGNSGGSCGDSKSVRESHGKFRGPLAKGCSWGGLSQWPICQKGIGQLALHLGAVVLPTTLAVFLNAVGQGKGYDCLQN